MIPFLVVAVLLTLLAVAVITLPMLRGEPGDREPGAAVAFAVLIPVSVVLLYAWISDYPWPSNAAAPNGQETTAAVLPNDSPEIAALRNTAAVSPGDINAWIRLADAYMSEERFADARNAYQQAVNLDRKGDDALRLALAEATILTDRASLQGDAGRLVEDVLSRNPSDPKALWYGGMVAFGKGDTEAARARWSALLALSPPPQIREIIEQQLAGLAAPPSTMDSQFRVPLRITLSPNVRKHVKPGASLFVIARDPGQGEGPPVAVIRRSAESLPADIEVGDTDVMLPGKTLSALPEIRFVARIANGGDAKASPGDPFGEAVWRANENRDSRLEVHIDSLVGQ